MNSACAIICAPTKIWQPLIRFMTNKALDRKNVPSACFSLILFFLNISQYFSYFSYFSILLIFRIFFIFRIFLNISHISQYLSMVVFFVYDWSKNWPNDRFLKKIGPTIDSLKHIFVIILTLFSESRAFRQKSDWQDKSRFYVVPDGKINTMI